MRTNTIYRLLLFLLLAVGMNEALAVNTAVSFANQNRMTNNGAGVYTAAVNAGNQYALALADLSDIPGIGTVGIVTIQFDSYITSGSRWLIGIGDKNVRGTNSNGSSKSVYNTDGLMMRFGTNDGVYYRMNGTTNNTAAFGTTVHTSISFNRNAGTYSYTLSSGWTVLFSETGVSTSVENITVVEAYTWQNSAQITLSNVTVQFDDFYFSDPGGTKYIEDLMYTNSLVNYGFNNVSYSSSTNSYWRTDNPNVYFIRTTGNEPANPTEGDYITVSASATGVEPTRFRVRIKTRNLLYASNMAGTNSFDVGNTLGMLADHSVTLDGLTLYLGYAGHVPVVRSINGGYGLTIIDSNGYVFANYAEGHEWGTMYKIVTTRANNLTVSGYFSTTWASAAQLYDSWMNPINGKTIANPGDGSLATAVFSLDAYQTYYLYSPGYDVFALKYLSYQDAHFEQSYAVTTIGSTYRQTASNMINPVYSIVGKEGDLVSANVSINSTTGEVSGLTAGGALKIQATGGGGTTYYYLTVAYPATEYPGRLWNFLTQTNNDGDEEKRVLNTSDGLKAVPVPTNSTIDNYGEGWTAAYKNSSISTKRNPRWYRDRTVTGDNAFAVSETAGLVFTTGQRGFYLRNDASEYTHIGIRGYGATMTIPQLEAGDIVEIMWRHETSEAGTRFTATNVTDLRGKTVNEDFQITESARRSITRYVGYYSFIATGGDVTFTLQDDGNCDIQSIRIYKGPYRSTMRNINFSGNTPASPTMLVDNAQQTYTFNYCNQLYSTATGPAMYVMKGYRPKTSEGQVLGVDYDHPGVVTGVNSALNPVEFVDEDAYPISNEERQKLYELRKKIIGLEVYNSPWQSSNNSYNNGIIRATSGWGKITIRMNNYTNDMKYLIGYTNDYTLTIGSAPHQTYPYTWDFTNISAQTANGTSSNVYNTVVNQDLWNTNWEQEAGTGIFTLITENTKPLESQYVPGAVLVTTDKALSRFNGAATYDYALDELDGLGFNGTITFDSESKTATSRRAAPQRASSSIITLLSFTMDDYKVVNTTEEVDGETVVTDWKNSTDSYMQAGGGWVKFGMDKIEDFEGASCGFGYKCDRAASSGSGVYLHPARKLMVGDVITIKAYATSSPTDDKRYGIGIYTENGTTPLATQFIGNGEKDKEVELVYTVTEGNGLANQNVISLYREDNSVYITEVHIIGDANAERARREIICQTQTTITVPDLNANGKQDWIYVSASEQPMEVVNATLVASGTDGPDANADNDVYKYKVTAAGNAYLTFPEETRIYKIGVTHILKEIHPVGGVGWATESRNHAIDHGLTGYFTKNDANAYTVNYDSYDLKTATVALTPISEGGYVPETTGIVMRLDNIGGLDDANSGKYVPLFYPSYTRAAATIANDNMMVPVVTGGRQWLEVNANGQQKFILTNVHWRYTSGSGWSNKITETDAAGFYRLHVWGDEDLDRLADNTAYLGVPEGELPIAVWNAASGARRYSLGIRELGDDATDIGGTPLVEPESTNGDIYNCEGMKLNGKPKKAGVYIMNRKKVIVK